MGDVSEPTVDVYRSSGTWAKPPGARQIEIILVGADSSDGHCGETAIRTFAADDIPDAVELTVGAASAWPGGSGANQGRVSYTAGWKGPEGGLAVIITRY